MQMCQNVIFYITGADRKNFNSVGLSKRRIFFFQLFVSTLFCFKSVLSIIEGHFPAGTSVNTLAQFAQGYNAGEKNREYYNQLAYLKNFNLQFLILPVLGKREGEQFRAYNHGLSENLRRYGLPVPPTYNLTRVTAPVYLFWGPGDLLASPKVYQILRLYNGRI
jgi:hypothetical protein